MHISFFCPCAITPTQDRHNRALPWFCRLKNLRITLSIKMAAFSSIENGTLIPFLGNVIVVYPANEISALALLRFSIALFLLHKPFAFFIICFSKVRAIMFSFFLE